MPQQCIPGIQQSSVFDQVDQKRETQEGDIPDTITQSRGDLSDFGSGRPCRAAQRGEHGLNIALNRFLQTCRRPGTDLAQFALHFNRAGILLP